MYLAMIGEVLHLYLPCLEVLEERIQMDFVVFLYQQLNGTFVFHAQ